MPEEEVQEMEEILSSEVKLDIAVIAMTKFDHATDVSIPNC